MVEAREDAVGWSAEVERLAALRRSLAQARARNAEQLAQRQLQERALAEAYAERRGRQARERREERQGRLAQREAHARSWEPPALLVDQEPLMRGMALVALGSSGLGTSETEAFATTASEICDWAREKRSFWSWGRGLDRILLLAYEIF